MALFYHHLWVKDQPPVEALRQSQLALYRHPAEARTLARGRGPDFDKTVRRVTQQPPAGERPQRTALIRDWAAFVLSGSGR
jgi:CHAT domain-containing protein